MAQVQLGRCYSIPITQVLGVKRGKERIGGLVPKNWDKWRALHVINMPTFESTPIARLWGRMPVEQIGLLALVYWQLVGWAINPPGMERGLMGYLVTSGSDGRIRPRTDDNLARLLGLAPAQWQNMAELLTGTLGLLVCTQATVEVSEDVRVSDGQLGLPFGASEAGTAPEDGVESAATTFRKVESHETKRSATHDTNERGVAHVAGTIGADRLAAGLAAPGGGRTGGDRLDVEVLLLRGALREACLGDEQEKARAAWMRGVALLLGLGDAPPESDEKDLQQTFTRCWTLQTRQKFEPDGSERLRRLDELFQKAVELHEDESVTCRIAVFNAHASQIGLRRSRSRKGVRA